MSASKSYIDNKIFSICALHVSQCDVASVVSASQVYCLSSQKNGMYSFLFISSCTFVCVLYKFDSI